jgi:ABC-type cobalamin/Fe3+-siderophores transport system ATPase subunit
VKLEWSDLTVSIRDREILSGVSGTLEGGRLEAVIGPNGAGKSTLLKILAGICPPTRGSVLLDGRGVRAWSAPERACRMAFLPQFRPVTTPVVVEDLVSMGRLSHRGLWRPLGRDDRRTVEDAMERMGIAHLGRRDASTLSGGELQRAFLARCLAQGSPVLLLDEPLTGLDIGHQLTLLAILEDLAREGRTVLWSVHDLRLAAEHSGGIWLLDKGHLTARGPVAQVLESQPARAAFGVDIRRAPDGDWRFSK